MTDPLAPIADALAARRQALLARWRAAADADTELTTASALSLAQFYDHIPEVLDAFARRLQARRPGERADAARDERNGAEGHGLVRWQQGYRQRELMREWRHLHLVLVDELETLAAEQPEIGAAAFARARRELAVLAADGACDSATQYARLQQIEAAGRLADLEAALGSLERLQTERAEILREAAHDLRGSLGVMHQATMTLRIDPASPPAQAGTIELLERGVASMQALLNDLISLARLEAGHEQRSIESCDAAAILRDLCAAMTPLARARALAIVTDGPASLPVAGDPTKLRRIAQNLLLNALKYTQRGGVVVAWAEAPGDSPRWMLSIQDTGPGLAREAAPIAQALKSATEEAQAVEARAAPAAQAAVEPAALLSSLSGLAPESPGEGIGLAIVKRLCELLDATLELHAEPGKGTTFRIFFPREY